MSKHTKKGLAILGRRLQRSAGGDEPDCSRVRLSRYICSLSCATVWMALTTS